MMEVFTSIIVLLFWFASIIIPIVIAGSTPEKEYEEDRTMSAKKDSHFLKG
jgi:hypothetical protein